MTGVELRSPKRVVFGAKQFLASRFVSARDKTTANPRRISEDFNKEQAQICRQKPIEVRLLSPYAFDAVSSPMLMMNTSELINHDDVDRKEN